jgi:hypothetical protein
VYDSVEIIAPEQSDDNKSISVGRGLRGLVGRAGGPRGPQTNSVPIARLDWCQALTVPSVTEFDEHKCLSQCAFLTV